jgi:hypothetical protein
MRNTNLGRAQRGLKSREDTQLSSTPEHALESEMLLRVSPRQENMDIRKPRHTDVTLLSSIKEMIPFISLILKVSAWVFIAWVYTIYKDYFISKLV